MNNTRWIRSPMTCAPLILVLDTSFNLLSRIHQLSTCIYPALIQHRTLVIYLHFISQLPVFLIWHVHTLELCFTEVGYRQS